MAHQWQQGEGNGRGGNRSSFLFVVQMNLCQIILVCPAQKELQTKQEILHLNQIQRVMEMNHLLFGHLL